jgi:nickel/cobalt exporter
VRRWLAAAALGLVLALVPSVAAAHPLGNFTINRYAGLLVSPETLLIDYVLDMAEIPALQERGAIEPDPRAACATLARAVRVRIDGREGALRVDAATLTFPPGQAGLDTLRLECAFSAALTLDADARHELDFADANYADRIGWREVTARGEGVRLATSLPRESISARLTTYPQDPLAQAPDVRAGTVTFVRDPGAITSAPSATHSSTPRSADELAALITRGDLGPALALLLALALGALHALSPGHGKTVMAAYLVGTRGTSRAALVLGLAVAVSHTAGVLGLALVTLAGHTLVAPERLYPYLSTLSALIVLGLGIAMVASRIGQRRDHRGPHGHAEVPGGWRSLAALGLAGGLVPSTSALLLLLGAISLQRIDLGVALILAFGAGMAATLVGAGLAVVSAGRAAQRAFAGEARVRRAVDLVSGAAPFVVLLLGIGMTAGSLASLP